MKTDVLTGWLGEGGMAVPSDRAEVRAARCEHCPNNKNALWWQKTLVKPTVLALRKTLELKNKLDMRVSNEKELGFCSVCDCCLSLKVHVPLDVVLRNSTMEQVVEFEKVKCWITEERKHS